MLKVDRNLEEPLHRQRFPLGKLIGELQPWCPLPLRGLRGPHKQCGTPWLSAPLLRDEPS